MEMFLGVIALLLFLILTVLLTINARLKERFPTEKEKDRQWALKDPMGHAEAHMKDKK